MTPDPKRLHPKKGKHKCNSNSCMRVVTVKGEICPSCQIKMATKKPIQKKEPKPKQIELFEKPKKTKSQIDLDKNKRLFDETLIEFQRLRRLQESDENGYCKCVNGEIMKWNAYGKYYNEQCHSGHYFSAGKCRNTAFVSMNVHPQNGAKNMTMGDGFVADEYKSYLIKRYGKEAFESLEIQARIPKKWSNFELIQMRKEYNRQYLELLKEKGF